jgi:hypothetical protein
MLQLVVIILSIIVLFLIYYITIPRRRRIREGFLELDEMETPLVINNECNWNNNICDKDIPLITTSCNNVPGFPKGLEPKPTMINQIEYPEVPFNRLASKSGKYTFVIPELKYDGIYSRKINSNNECYWTTSSNNNKETYGTDKYFHIPDKNLYGITVFSPLECEKYYTGYPQDIYLNNCKKNTYQEVSYTIDK